MLDGVWSVDVVANVAEVPRGSPVKLLNAIGAMVKLRFGAYLVLVGTILRDTDGCTPPLTSKRDDLYAELWVTWNKAMETLGSLRAVKEDALNSADEQYVLADQELDLEPIRFQSMSAPYKRTFRDLTSDFLHEHFFDIFATFLVHKTEKSAVRIAMTLKPSSIRRQPSPEEGEMSHQVMRLPFKKSENCRPCPRKP
ncbi:hypothetical protein LTS18_004670 [Coniosporium uncinatum]|uniref:Uncharacterized protein n=1 Tax=Coniosporium uncinatum TaxID=93489 RepID=A0ACC3DSA3_9PEZI|nr:hypothetical protein LTS18_004670 [Coniosporium uncinatum]